MLYGFPAGWQLWLAEDVNMAGCRGLKLSIYAENLPNDVRKGYRKKLKYSHDDLLDTYMS